MCRAFRCAIIAGPNCFKNCHARNWDCGQEGRECSHMQSGASVKMFEGGGIEFTNGVKKGDGWVGD